MDFLCGFLIPNFTEIRPEEAAERRNESINKPIDVPATMRKRLLRASLSDKLYEWHVESTCAEASDFHTVPDR